MAIVPTTIRAILATALAATAVHSGTGIAVGPDGLIYFSDTVRDIVWRIESDGALTQVSADVHTNVLFIAADGTPYYPPGGYPPAGYYFVTDGPDGRGYATLRSMVVEILADGSTVTLAGDSTPGFRDGPAEEALFDRPQGLAVDSAGAIYVADHGNRRVRVIRGDGTVATVARSGWPWTPTGVVVAGDRLYVLERLGKYWGFPIVSMYLRTVMDHPRVRVITPGGAAQVVAAVPVRRGPAIAWSAAVLAIVFAALGLGIYGHRVRQT